MGQRTLGSTRVVSAPLFKLWPPKSRPPDPASAARALTLSATPEGAIAWLPSWGRGGGSPGWALFGSQTRRTTRPGVMSSAASQAASACTGRARFGRRAVGRSRRGSGPLGLRQGEPQTAIGLSQVLSEDRGQLEAVQRAGAFVGQGELVSFRRPGGDHASHRVGQAPRRRHLRKRPGGAMTTWPGCSAPSFSGSLPCRRDGRLFCVCSAPGGRILVARCRSQA